MLTDDVLTIRELAAEVRRDPQSIRVWVRDHGLPAFRKGVQLFIRRDDFEEWKRQEAASRMLAKGEKLIAIRSAAS